MGPLSPAPELTLVKPSSSPKAAALAAPRESAGFANALRGSLCCGVLAVDARGKLTVFAPELEELLRLRAADVLGQSFEVLPAPLHKLVATTLATGAAAPAAQIKIASGPDEHAVHAFTVPGGPAGGLILVLHDLTPARRLEQNLRRLDRLANAGMLSASVAHEIKNAIVAIKTFVDLLLEKNQDAELAEIVGQEMKRINGLVSQMLRVANPARPATGPLSVHELVDYALRLVQHQMHEKLIGLQKHFAAADDIVLGSAHQLDQAFMNLFLNALEAMGANGTLGVATEAVPASGATPAAIRVTISDTGIGIPPENLGRMFETFFTTKKNGTGLGLAITRRIVQEHQGEITVTSRPDQGATFTVVLPLAGKKA
jgi:two-component system, NtrC family, sensor histidine kinase HydH